MKALNNLTVERPIRKERVIQFGEGNFLRCFADWIIFRMNQNTDFNGNVVVVQPIEKGMTDILTKQDGLYHVILQGKLGDEIKDTCELVDVISRTINPYEDFDSYIKLAEHEDIRFVISNTTEAGISFNPSCKLNDSPASSYPGKLTQLLYQRYRFFNGDLSKGLIIFPCELIFLNGYQLKEIIYKYIDLWNLGEGFKSWFDNSCGVYATLVDRIVPGFPFKAISTIKEKTGYDDNLVVQGEYFHLWVIEAPKYVSDEFPANKAGLNVLFVSSEKPYHERKVTMLNGVHTILAPIAYLSGIDIVRDACNDEVLGKYIRKVMFEELMQTLTLSDEELKKYAENVIERFKNPFMDHLVSSIMLNAFPKFAYRDVPPIKKYLSIKGQLPWGIVLGMAALMVYYKGGKRVDGKDFIPNDSQKIVDFIKLSWTLPSVMDTVEHILGAEFIWGENLNILPGLARHLTSIIEDIMDKGMYEVVKEYIK